MLIGIFWLGPLLSKALQSKYSAKIEFNVYSLTPETNRVLKGELFSFFIKYEILLQGKAFG